MIWRKSSYSNPSGNSVIVAEHDLAGEAVPLDGHLIAVSSDHPIWAAHFAACAHRDKPRLALRTVDAVAFTPEEWRAFIAGVKNGEFDLGPSGHLVHR